MRICTQCGAEYGDEETLATCIAAESKGICGGDIEPPNFKCGRCRDTGLRFDLQKNKHTPCDCRRKKNANT